MAEELKRDGAHTSMYLSRLAGQKYVTSDTALAFAQMVIRDNFSEDELKLQSPLDVREDGDNWVIKGAKQKNLGASVPANRLLESNISIIISQFDGQILQIAFEGVPTPVDRHGRPLE